MAKKTKQGTFRKIVQNPRTRILLGALVVGVIGTIYILATNAISPNANERAVVPFQTDIKRGLVWDGLERNSEICPGGYLVANQRANLDDRFCTHGPDPAPQGLDATISVEPLASGEEVTAQTTSSIVCEGDGVSGNRVEIIYAHASDKPNRYEQYRSSFQSYATSMNSIFVESGKQTGSERNIRFVTTPGCEVAIQNITLSPTGDDTFSNTNNELIAKGLNRTDRKYLVLVDATVYCGLAGMYVDSNPAQTNPNNRGPLYGRIDSGCWGGSVAAHELSHMLGAVQLDAPNATKGLHCSDDHDLMCYDDGSGVALRQVCPISEASILDCNKDDYFNSSSSIPSSNYLATHWNIANNQFLIKPSLTNPTPEPTPDPSPSPTTDTGAPIVKIQSPSNNSNIGNKVAVNASASDNVSVVRMEVLIDGKLAFTTNSNSLRYNWNTRKVSRGQHSITIKAYDAANNIGQATVFVTK